MKRLTLLVCLLFCVAAPAFAATTCPNAPSVGTTSCTFFATDFSQATPAETNVTATCRRATSKLFVFVEDALWLSGTIDDDSLDYVVSAFETATPRTTESGLLGIGPALNLMLGPQPDQFDGIPQLYLVITQIPSNGLTPVTSYFRTEDLVKDQWGEAAATSNKHELIFLHGLQLDSERRMADLVRSYANLIHWGADTAEEPWAIDSIARGLSFWLGYKAYETEVESFALAPTKSLLGTVQGDTIKLNPGATALFGDYLIERISAGFMGLWMADPHPGISGFEEALKLSGLQEKNFCDYMHGWVVQNGIGKGDYQYALLSVPAFKRYAIRSHPGNVIVELTPYAGTYVSIDASSASPGSSLEVTYEISDTTGILITIARASSKDPTYLDVQEVEVLANQPTRLVFDDIGEGHDQVYVLSSRCADGVALTYTVTSAIVEPVDGDQDADTSETDGDSDTTDTDTTDTDSDTTPDGDSEKDDDLIIAGDKNCHEIHDCIAACADAACRDSCPKLGTLDAQAEWKDFLRCINGYNPVYENCLDSTKTTFERERCIHLNCPNQLAICSTTATVTPTTKKSGGCAEASALSGLLLLGLFAILWRRRQTT